jgi:ABC-type nitrate/sulfonate/bicarbonate transport system substrate-binding protein
MRACALLALLVAAPAHAGTPVRIILPETGNLQHMAFWVARGAGLFEREGLDVTLAIPSSPGGVYQLVLADDAQAAVLPPPVYLDLIAQHAPIQLVANLLRNEPANLAVRRSVLESRKISPQTPLAERLRGLRGVKIGVAPGPVGRLRTLLAGVDGIEIAGVPGPEQNAAFADGRVDALFAHTPYLERALIEQDAVLLVNTSSGEVPQLASRQIHALCVRTEWAKTHASEVAALVRALTAAEQMIHHDRSGTVDALVRAVPGRSRALIERIVDIYEPAIPQTPTVSVDGIRGALALFPSSRTAPDLSGVDLANYVANGFGERAWKLPILASAAILLMIAVVWSVRIRRGSRPREAAR